MAKAKDGTARAPGEAVAKAPDLDELSELVGQTVELEAQHAEGGLAQKSYLKILGNKANDPIMNPKKPEYIKGAANETWVIPNRKLLLGKEVILTVLGVFKLYEDSIEPEPTPEERKAKIKPKPKVVAYWPPVDAENVPVEGAFNRPYVDTKGVEHVLRPVHWAYVYLHDFPDVDDAVLTFRSTGNSVCRELQKLLEPFEVSTQARLKLSSQEIASKDFGEYLYPAFEVDGNNYDMVDGKIKLRKDGFGIETLTGVVKAAKFLQETYVGYKMVSRIKDIASLIAGAAGDKHGAIADAEVIADNKPVAKPKRF